MTVGDTVVVTPNGLLCVAGSYADLVEKAEGVVMDAVPVMPTGLRCRVRWYDPATGNGINAVGLDEGWPDHLLSVKKTGC